MNIPGLWCIIGGAVVIALALTAKWSSPPRPRQDQHYIFFVESDGE